MIININGESREMTEDELERYKSMETHDEATQLDVIEAQVIYTAMMTGTLIED